MIIGREPDPAERGGTPSDGLIEPVRNAAAPLGRVAGGNPLADDWARPDPGGVDRIVLWSGTLADGLFESHPRTWMAGGRETLDRRCAELAEPLAGTGVRLCFRPHTRHVLSDVPSCRRFLDDHADEPFGVALSPGTLLEPGMLETADEHLDRLFETLAPRAELIFLHDVAVTEDGRCSPVPLGRGRLPVTHLRGLVERYVPATTPVILLPDDLEGQLAWLAGGASPV